jgi:hypothetical protein
MIFILGIIFSCLFIALAHRAVNRCETSAGPWYFAAALFSGFLGFGSLVVSALRLWN